MNILQDFPVVQIYFVFLYNSTRIIVFLQKTPTVSQMQLGGNIFHNSLKYTSKNHKIDLYQETNSKNYLIPHN